MTTSVIFLGLVVMWVIILVPMWLRRHDEVEESRSLDRFSTAMHTLARREEPAEKKYVVMPHRSRALEVHVSGASADGRRSTRSPAARRARAARRVLTPAARRRRTLIGLLIATTLTMVGAVVVGGLALWGLQVFADVCLLAFVGHLRNRARRARATRPARRRPPAPARPAAPQRVARAPRPARTARPAHPARPAPLAEPAVPAAEPVVTPAAATAAAAMQADPIFDQTSEPDFDQVAIDGKRHVVYHFDDTGLVGDETGSLAEPAAVVADEQVASYQPVAEPKRQVQPEPAADADFDSEIGERPWEPVPVPRPVYTTKPAAPQRKRRAPIMEPLLPPVDSPAELDPVDDLEEILDRRWAVND